MHEIQVKSILSARNGMNLYRGCTHGCIYCDSRSECYQMAHPFEDIAVKANALTLLEDALSVCAAKAETDADYLGLAAGALPEGMTLEDREVIWTEESDGRTLSCRVELAESGALPRTIWRVHRLEATVGAGWTEETFEE